MKNLHNDGAYFGPRGTKMTATWATLALLLGTAVTLNLGCDLPGGEALDLDRGETDCGAENPELVLDVDLAFEVEGTARLHIPDGVPVGIMSEMGGYVEDGMLHQVSNDEGETDYDYLPTGTTTEWVGLDGDVDFAAPDAFFLLEGTTKVHRYYLNPTEIPIVSSVDHGWGSWAITGGTGSTSEGGHEVELFLVVAEGSTAHVYAAVDLGQALQFYYWMDYSLPESMDGDFGAYIDGETIKLLRYEFVASEPEPDPEKGPCCETHGDTGCYDEANPQCEEIVCVQGVQTFLMGSELKEDFDLGTCCSDRWGQECVYWADYVCGEPGYSPITDHGVANFCSEEPS